MARAHATRLGAPALLLILAACSKPAEKTATLSAPSGGRLASDAGATPTIVASPAPAVPERWQILLRKGHRSTLHDSIRGQTLVAEVTDVRPVGAATVVRIAWRLDGEPFISSGTPRQIALTPKGAFFLGRDLGDADIPKALASPATVPEPPVPVPSMSREDGRYLLVKDHAGESEVCVGEGPGPDAGMCDDTCDAAVCFASKRGFTLLFGNFAPDKLFFEAAAPRLDAGR
jgi:hypothetical protein